MIRIYITFFMVLSVFIAEYGHTEEPAASQEKNQLIEVEAEGEALLGDDTTLAQARAMARNNARRNALEQAVGIEVHGSTVIYNSDLVSDLVIAATRGLIVEEEIIDESPRVEGKYVFHYCKLRAHIKPINMEKRGDLKVLRAEVFRADREKGSRLPVFQENDEIRISTSVNNMSFINIFSVSQEGMISKLYPNQYVKNMPVMKNKVFTFPDNTHNSLGIKLRVKPAGKLSSSVESVLVIATKEEVHFLSNEELKEPTITDLMRELSELDPSLWAEKTVGYEVRK